MLYKEGQAVQYFIISFQIIFPILFFMALGIVIRQTKLLNESAFSQINKLVFRVFLPVKLFLDIYHSDFESAFQPRLILYVVTAVLLIYAGTWRLVGRIVKDRQDAPSIIQTIYRSNYVLFGMSIAGNMYPGEDLGVISVMAAFIVPLFNILAVTLFEVYRGGKKVSIAHLLMGIAKNSLVIGSVLGLLLLGLGIELPGLIVKPLTDLGAIATPLALLCVGATLTFDALKKYTKYLIGMTLGRLIIVPGIFLSAAIALGFRNMELAGLFLVFASPTATSAYPMAKELGGNGELAGLGVAVNNVACLFTMFLWIAFLKYFHLC